MRPIGPILKQYIEDKKMVKGKVAEKVGITYNYLSTIFQKETLDASLLERLCIATGLSPMSFFEYGGEGEKVNYSQIKANTRVGNTEVKINHNSSDIDTLKALIAEKDKQLSDKERIIGEKERTIQILLASSGLRLGTETGQK